MRRLVDTNVALAYSVRHDGHDPNTRRTTHTLVVQFRESPGRTHLRVLRDDVALGEPVGFNRVIGANERLEIEGRIRKLEDRPDILHTFLVDMAKELR